MKEVVIVSACRTPTGRLLGQLKGFTAPELGAIVVREAVKRAKVKPTQVDEVIMGCSLQAGLGQNPARQAAINGGLSNSTAAVTVNKVCASGLKAVAMAAQAIKAGDADIIVAGGMESMTNAPFLLQDMRRGKKYGTSKAIDSLLHDGLYDCYNETTMGCLCELTVTKYNISRKEQDQFAYQSHMKAARATKQGKFKKEIVPIKISSKKKSFVMDKDEPIRYDTSLQKLANLKPVFKNKGTITAGNSPGLNDGAACLVLMSAAKAKKLGIKPLATILGYSTGHVDPKWFPIAPVTSIKKLLKKLKMKIDEFDLIEENEAFASQTLAVAKELKLNEKKVNVNGGAIALGHPIGASGARILVTLIYALKDRKKKTGLATLCLGGGGSVSMAITR